jgi:cell division protein FtsW
LVVVLLLLIGIVMVFTSSYYNAAYNPDQGMFYFLKRQGGFALFGFFAMLFVSNINYRFLLRFTPLIYVVALALQAVLPIIGSASHGATRWLNLPIIGRFQPSEISKLAIILAIAYTLHRRPNILKTWKGLAFCGGIVAVMAGFVLLGNLSTALVVCVIGFGMIFVASPHILRFVIAGGAGVAGLVSYIAVFSRDFRGERFAAWLDPFSDPQGYGFQAIQSLFAVASGGPFGLGLGESRQKSFVPEPHNDFIFAIICEELGAVGAGLVLLLFGILIWRGLKIAMDATDVFSSLLATGITLMIATQVVINVAVVTNSIPNTGIPLPFISYGGSGLIITMSLMGALLNISRYSRESA